MSEYSKLVPGMAVERGVHGAADAFGFVGRGEAPGVFQVDVGRQAGVVGQEFADGYFFFAVGGESGRYLTTGASKSSLPCLVELHDGGRGGEALGERGHVEDGVFGHGLGRGGFAVETGFVRRICGLP